ncbi:hybrid sensor histidine kinase/response regulator [Siphonobacter curvatus]|uniref:histidine kinase n=1 Tax=Siphonobacter curvatus TaxID=2094562 RepID=A0A2S7IK49_9BACT|nr:hybrid sensor histidine kinase/response regulator [Siphonobacter curvatus]PQA56876.1 hybrid sensor histidine kinase/response regulator [Siphonobacter curvatus]
MTIISSVMGYKRFAYFILLAFIAGTVLLLALQINSTRNTVKLINTNTTLLKELRAGNYLREIDRDILSVESRIRASIATNDTSHLKGVDENIDKVEMFLDSLSTNTTDTAVHRMIRRLSVLALEKKKTKERLLSRFLVKGNMNETSSIANPRARKISDEITATTAKIYESRQYEMMQLSQESEERGNKARWYDLSILILLLAGGGVICFFIVRQFQRQNQLIQELNESEKKASVAAQAKENFLANMSHEIRTPLSGMLGFTNLLQKRKLDAESMAFVHSIQKSGESLLAIINEILDLSKIEAGMMRITPGVFSVNGLVHSIQTLFGERLKEKGLQLYVTIDPAIPDTLIGDATRLTQVLVNLIGNAIKFTQQGHISIDVYNKSLGNKIIQLGFRITDTGIGIESEKLEEIFDRFNQGEASTTRNYGGTGLGLSIAKNLILLQQGAITVQSKPGKGTTFDFYIPYEVAEEQLDQKPVSEAIYLKDKTYMPLSILVVDDNATNQSLMKHLLLQWNVAFDTVSNGLEALEKLRDSTYDLILMDIQMPHMDGYTATQQIREVFQLDIPIIAMTAHAMAGEREKCLSRGMNEYISKPINEEELFNVISRFGFLKPKQPVAASEVIPGPYEKIDLSYMRLISGGDQNFEKKVTLQFIEEVPQALKQLIQAYQSGHYPLVNHMAHDLKTSVSMMGILPLLEDQLDFLEHQSQPVPEIPQVLQEVQTILETSLKEAMHYYAHHP